MRRPGGDAPITSKATTETVDLDATRQPLGLLGLVHAAEQLDTLISATVKHDTTPHRLVDQLLDAELDRREEHRLQTSLRLPGLPTGQNLSNFDSGFQPSVEGATTVTLATCQWMHDNRTVLIQGPPGVGNTHLGVALSVKAIEHDLGVSFYRLDELLASMHRDVELTPQALCQACYKLSRLLAEAR